MTKDNLEPISPAEAKEMYLEARKREVSQSTLDGEEAETLLEYQRRFKYASRAHVITEILWHTGVRLGSLRLLDVEDFDEEHERLEFTHRPDSETTLKNGDEGERMAALNAEVCRVIEDWRNHHRHDVEDEYGREPLLTSRNGRMNRTSFRDAITSTGFNSLFPPYLPRYRLVPSNQFPCRPAI